MRPESPSLSAEARIARDWTSRPRIRFRERAAGERGGGGPRRDGRARRWPARPVWATGEAGKEHEADHQDQAGRVAGNHGVEPASQLDRGKQRHRDQVQDQERSRKR